MKPTLDDAIAAAERLREAFLPKMRNRVDADRICAFLHALKAKAEPLRIANDEEGFMLECADQNGFDHIDDDIELMVVSSAKLIEFVKVNRRTLTDEMRVLVLNDLKDRLRLPPCDEARIGADEIMFDLNTISRSK